MLNQFKNIFSLPVSNQEDISYQKKDSHVPEHSVVAETIEFKIQEGDKLYDRGELEQAISYYHQAVEQDRNSARAHQKLAMALQKRGDLPQAMIHYRKAIVLNNAYENFVKEKKSVELPGKNLEQDLQKYTQVTENCSSNLSLPLSQKQHLQANQESTTQSAFIPSEKVTPNLKREAAEVYLQQALAYSEQQKWPEVVEACQHAVKIVPNLAEAYKLWGNALQRMGKTSEAMGFYAKALEIQPDLAEVYANLGSLYARQKKWQKAREYYQKAIIVKPNFPGAYRNLAKVWTQLGEPEKAVECQNQASSLEAQGVNAEAYVQSGDRLIGENKPEQAIEYYLQAVKLAPDSRLCYQKVAETWEKLGKWQEAATYYRYMLKLESAPSSQAPQLKGNGTTTALLSPQPPIPQLPVISKPQQLLPASQDVPSKQNTVIQNDNDKIGKLNLAIAKYEQQAQQLPDSAPLQANLGSLYAQKQEWHKALICYQKAINLNPEMAGVYRNLAKVLGKLGQEADAARCWYQALSLEPQSANAEQYYQLGDVLSKQNQLEEAITCYRRAIELEPTHARSYFRLGEIFQSCGRTTEARSCWQQAVKLDRANPDYYYRLGQLLVGEKNFERAIICYQNAIKLQPNRWEIAHQLGEILSQVERWAEAVAVYNRALAINNKNPELYLGFGNALAKTAELDKAIVAYQLALQIKPEYQEASVQLANILREKDGDTSNINTEVNLGKNEGIILVREQKFEEAIAYYQKAIQLEPKCWENYYQLGEVLSKVEKWQEAVIAYNRCLKINPTFQKARTKRQYCQRQKAKANLPSSFKNFAPTEYQNSSSLAKIERKITNILLVANEPPPIRNFLTTAPGLRIYGIAEGLFKHNYNIRIVSPINLKSIHDQRDYVFSNSNEIKIDYIEMQFLSSYIINHSPDVCIFTNFIQYSKLDENIKQEIFRRSRKKTKFIYDLFAPKILEQMSSISKSDVKIGNFIEQKRNALLKSDAFCVNGEKKFGYTLGWLSSINADVSKPIVITNMCLPSSIGNDANKQIEKSYNIKSKLTFLLGGHKQSWNQSNINYVELISKISSKGWNIVNVGTPSFASYFESPFAEKFVIEGNHLENFETLDYYQYQKLLNEKIDIAIDLFSLNRERQLAMVTRSVVALSSGKPVIHPRGTEVAALIEQYDAGWLYKDENEVFGIIDWIAANPDSLKQKKINVARLYREKFSPIVAVGSLARMIAELGDSSNKQSDKLLDEELIKSSDRRAAFLQLNWYMSKHKLQSKIWNGELENPCDYFLNSNLDRESTPNFLLDFIVKRKRLYEKSYLGGDSLENLKNLPIKKWVELCGIWIDIPWYIKKNNLADNQIEAIAHYFKGNNCLEVSPNRFFQEKWYREYYPEVQEAIDLNFYINGFHHFLDLGMEKGYSPSPFFDNEFYLSWHKDLELDIQNKIYLNGFEHYMLSSDKWSKVNCLTPIFNCEYYVNSYPSLFEQIDPEQKNKFSIFDFIDRGIKRNRLGSLFHNKLQSEIKRFQLKEFNDRARNALEKINNQWGYANISGHFFGHYTNKNEELKSMLLKHNLWLKKIILYLKIHD